jgi:hypothetical protein
MQTQMQMQTIIFAHCIDIIIFAVYIEFNLFAILTILRNIGRVFRLCKCIHFIIEMIHPCNAFFILHQHHNIMSDYEPSQLVFNTLVFNTPVFNTQEESRDETYYWICSSVNEKWHIVQDYSGKYHIGLIIEVVDSNNNVALCMDVLMVSQSFFTFPMQTAKSYLIELAGEDDDEVILASDFEHAIHFQGLYDLPSSPLIIKTHLICIIQRRWKRIYKERMQKLLARGRLNAQRTFELCGKYIA